MSETGIYPLNHLESEILEGRHDHQLARIVAVIGGLAPRTSEENRALMAAERRIEFLKLDTVIRNTFTGPVSDRIL